MKTKLLFSLLFLTITVFSISAFSQTLKTFNGPFDGGGRTQSGTATYTYYEDAETHNYVKQGLFKYTYNHIGFSQTITGSFIKGLRNGVWTSSITMTDWGTQNPYSTGTISLTTNYKNGYADGNWKLLKSLKTRNKYLSYGAYKWEAYSPIKTKTINMNFKSGYMVGAVNIIADDLDGYFKANGNFDNNSLCVGTWTINDGSINKEFIYKDNFLYEFIARDDKGEIMRNMNGYAKYDNQYLYFVKAKEMSPKQREDEGIHIDTTGSKVNDNIYYYFNSLFSNDYFLFDDIGGDLSYKAKKFLGGFELKISQTETKEDKRKKDSLNVISNKQAELQKHRKDSITELSRKLVEKNAEGKKQYEELSNKYLTFKGLYVVNKPSMYLVDKNKQPVIEETYPKGKHLYQKSEALIETLNNEYKNCSDIDKIIEKGKYLIAIIDKLIAISSTETKDIDKQMKNAETNEDVKKILGL